MNSASVKLLKQTMLESVVNKDSNKFREALKQVETLTYKKMVAESSEKIKRTYR